jgi:hypothetical protein
MTLIRITGQYHRFSGEELSWAGECPWTGGLCFGSETGKLLIPSPNQDELDLGGNATDAINGVAFCGKWFGVSTRNEVLLFQRLSPEAKPSLVHRFEGGAHGVVSTPSGVFVAPLGENGVLVLKPEDHAATKRMIIESHAEKLINYYHLVHLGAAGNEVFACAGRSDGILSIEGDWHRNVTIQPHPFVQRDVIDVCSLRSTQWPFAVAGLSRDGAIFLSRDLRMDSPTALTLPISQGTGYALASSGGHIFLLTDKAFYVLPHFGLRFLNGEALNRPVVAPEIPVSAAYLAVAYDRTLLLGLDAEVVSFDIETVVRRIEEGVSGVIAKNGEPVENEWGLKELIPQAQDSSEQRSQQLEFQSVMT